MARAMAEINVEPTRDEPPYAFSVEVAEKGGSTLHDVTLDGPTHARLAGDDVPPDRFVEACFRFLLDREPKEAILAEFDVDVIGTYFDDFEDEIGGYL